MDSTGEGDVYLRGHLEMGGSEEFHEADTHGGPTRAPVFVKDSQEVLEEYRRGRVSMTGADIEALVKADQMREVWSKIQRWFNQAKGHPPPLTREGLERTSTLREDIYRRCPPEGEEIPILVQLARVADDIPEREDIAVAVQRLKMGREGNPSRIRA